MSKSDTLTAIIIIEGMIKELKSIALLRLSDETLVSIQERTGTIIDLEFVLAVLLETEVIEGYGP